MDNKTKININILGTNYEVITQTEEENPKLCDVDGLCEIYSHKIILRDIPTNPKNFENIAEYKKSVVRHEVIHAFFAESGLRMNYADNEELVDWIATQFYKIDRVFGDLKVKEII